MQLCETRPANDAGNKPARWCVVTLTRDCLQNRLAFLLLFIFLISILFKCFYNNVTFFAGGTQTKLRHKSWTATKYKNMNSEIRRVQDTFLSNHNTKLK